MIPKTVNYCWFGGKSKPDFIKKNIESWHRFLPDYEIVEWNESNYSYSKNKYMKEAYVQQNYAYVSDYARLDIINNTGGIYLDVDVELINPINDILEKGTFFATQDLGEINTGLIFGAPPKDYVVSKLLSLYNNRIFDSELDETTVTIVSHWFIDHGYIANNRLQKVKSATIYPVDYFCPMKFGDKKPKITSNSRSIHWYYGSWLTESKLQLGLSLFRVRWTRRIRNAIGIKRYKKLKQLFNR